jgi:acetyl-CoA carboxylase/biotin carboxylase 1
MQEIEEKIKSREEQLKPLYTQLACEFADLHDRTGRMEAKGVIRKGLEWKNARKFFYLRVKRRLLENEVVSRLEATGMTHEDAKAKLESWAAFDDDAEAVDFLQNSPMEKSIAESEVEALKEQILALKERLPADEAKNLFGA